MAGPQVASTSVDRNNNEMPELPEVERARKLIADTCQGYKITDVITTEDKIVYAGGIQHGDYADALKGRTITGCLRKGKIFWIQLTGLGLLPVMHFGMTGMLMLKGRQPDWYMRRPKRSAERKAEWPPKYMKFVLKLSPPAGSGGEDAELAFLDSRRLARLRLVPQPVEEHPPVSQLGFDPLLSPPTLPEFVTLLRHHRGTIKGRIMDQHFSAGVGNWVADEILHLSRVHPAMPITLMDDEQIERIWFNMKEVCRIAVEVNAHHAKFPHHWLFSWRWRKGKKDRARKDKDEEGGMRLPNGEPATLEFCTVGGRTSAYIEELQKLPNGYVIPEKKTRKVKSKEDEVSIDQSDDEMAPHGETDSIPPLSPPAPVPSRSRKRVKAEAPLSEEDAKPKRTYKRKKTSSAEQNAEANAAADSPIAKRSRKPPREREIEAAAKGLRAVVEVVPKQEALSFSSDLSDVD